MGQSDNFPLWWGAEGKGGISSGLFQPYTSSQTFTPEPGELLCAELCAALSPSKAAQSSLTGSWWLEQPGQSIHSAMLPSTAPESDWYPKMPNTFSCRWIHWREIRLPRTLGTIWDQASRRKAAALLENLPDAFQAKKEKKRNHRNLKEKDHLSLDIPFYLAQLYGVYHNILPAYLLLPLQPGLHKWWRAEVFVSQS